MMQWQEERSAVFSHARRTNHPSGLGAIAPSRATAATQPPTRVHALTRGPPGTHGYTVEFVFTSRLSTLSWQRTNVIVCNSQQLSARYITKRVWTVVSLVLHAGLVDRKWVNQTRSHCGDKIWRKLRVKSPASFMD